MTGRRSGSAHERRVVVAGGAGFLGGHLCARLLADGYSVLCVDNFSTGRMDNVAALVGRPGFDLLDHDVVTRVPVTGSLDAVVNLACPASPQDYLRMPIETLRVASAGTLALLELAKATGARFVQASTSEVYGDPHVHPQREDYWGNVNPTGPRAVYDEGKRFGEAACAAFRREHGTNCGIVRIFNTYGPGMRSDDGRLIPNLVTQALAGGPLTIHGTGEQTRSLCYVADTVDALVRMIERDHPGPVNIGNATELTVLQIARVVQDLIGVRAPLVRLPAMVDDPRSRKPDIRLAERVLGWRPRTDLREGLRRTIRHFADRRDPAAADRGTRTN